ncbi:MAG TPA: dethiobiotin synthase [Cyclobacteriaceae bacterium]|nr:dethiobiotin synthase [Cyclobacteriaceae bacterium]HMV10296.1 dethiobiotin synthase [Cyclobacteriaceae bacterium]HMV90620.1 dethiobiotin synthase [Cyclobacteriaceae bacterium]HMX02831.1 dethiobiotin synthase [Cyclobacteriaceae bacterium]HMX50049.1 dethiobiotin synthase [Cyclobacteriaceae bacterium]
MNYFVTGIDTDSGKTLVSAILCEAVGFDYWKPVQSGFPKDSDTIKSLSPRTKIHPEQYVLHTPASPHASAKIDGVHISLDALSLPQQDGLVIEGAGGCLVPLNDSNFVIDLFPKLNAEIILVADLYLGSINHTLLSANLLRTRNYRVKGIVFNGPSTPESERIILHHTQYPCILRIEKEKEITSATIKKYSDQLRKNLS